MQYTLKKCQRWSWTPVLTSDMLNVAGVHGKLEAAEWLRSEGAKWPAVLRKHDQKWPEVMLAWARKNGCTSPVDKGHCITTGTTSYTQLFDTKTAAVRVCWHAVLSATASAIML
eukprot:13984-Heterococcus_DN1.PRE.2